MNEFVMFLHFVGLMMGSAGGLGSAIAMRRALALPADQAPTLRALGPIFANVTAIGLALLWITGLWLVFGKWGGFANLPGLFWWKLALVVLVTIFTGAVHMTYAQIRRTRNPALAKRFAVLGPLSGISVLLIVLIAVYAFD
jgi:hypothetical protein